MRAVVLLAIVMLAAAGCADLIGADFDRSPGAGTDPGPSPDAADGGDGGRERRRDAGDAATVEAPPTIAQIASGGTHVCVRFEDGRVKCWGHNAYGQLGLGDTHDRGDGPGEMGAALPAVDLGPGRSARQLALGNGFSCALRDDGSVTCWGSNEFGELGRGNTVQVGDDPGELASAGAIDLGGHAAKMVTAGAKHACALLDDGTTRCWGRNEAGELGVGSVKNQGDAPEEMGPQLRAVDLGTTRTTLGIAAGARHTCAWFDDGKVKCWGLAYHGQLGLGDTDNRGDAPGEMGEALPAVEIGHLVIGIAAGNSHTCALLVDRTVKCWGDGHYGALGLGSASGRGAEPGQMGSALPTLDLGAGRTASSIAAGFDFTCALLDDRSLKCWGGNTFGQTGGGDTVRRGDHPDEMGDALRPVDLGAGAVARALDASGYQSCVLLESGAVKCWGSNKFGQLGLGNRTDIGATPMGDALPALDLVW